MIDAVYVLKEAELNEELRYSLRSVATNWPDVRVVIAGYKPSWVTNVVHIPVTQVKGEKHPNSLRNQRAALTSELTSDPFWFFNDDFFVMKPGATVYNWGFVQDVLDSYGPERLGSSYYRSMVATRDILVGLGVEEPVSYAAHVPLLTHKAAMLEAMDTYNRDDCWVQHATIMGNLVGLGGETLPYGDVKVYDPYKTELPSWIKESEYVSTHDMSFDRGSVGSWIRRRFPDPCKYEA